VTLLALFGGLALLLYGVQLIGEGLQRAAGGHLRHLVTTMTRSRLTAVGSGALVTALTQSSSATTLMLIGFVSAGLVSFRQSLGVILGADIGTTFTVQLLAFNVQQFSLLLIGIGFAIGFFGRRGTVKNLGQALLGFGFIFLGMKVMNDGLAPLAAYELTRQVLVALAGNPFMGLLVGAVLSASMASSAATIGLMLSVVQQGLLPLDGAIPVVLGANIGTCATASNIGGCRCSSSRLPRLCIRTTPARLALTTSAIPGPKRNALMSFTICAPAARERRATSGR
jgi:phosphate:Na+ symporter